LNRGCFEAILMKSIPRTLGVNGKNVVTSNLINVNFSIFEKYKN
jgi:hypothetical protein